MSDTDLMPHPQTNLTVSTEDQQRLWEHWLTYGPGHGEPLTIILWDSGGTLWDDNATIWPM